MSTQYPPVTLPDTEVRLLKSKIAGDAFRLHVSPDLAILAGDGSYLRPA
jgi:hypothetical protein